MSLRVPAKCRLVLTVCMLLPLFSVPESQDSTESREAGTDRGEGGLVLELPPDNSNGGFGGYEEGRGPSPKRMLRPTRSFVRVRYAPTRSL
eukprot:3401046-Rhodomonas_salina.2